MPLKSEKNASMKRLLKRNLAAYGFWQVIIRVTNYNLPPLIPPAVKGTSKRNSILITIGVLYHSPDLLLPFLVSTQHGFSQLLEVICPDPQQL